MKWTVVWTRPELHDLRRLDRQVEERVRAAVRRLAETDQGDVTRLQGEEPPQWRLRKATGGFDSGSIQREHDVRATRAAAWTGLP